jgi:heptosyltransferase II
MKALVVAPSWIGDTILAQPLFERLHAYHPGLELDALAPRWVAPVLARMPQISSILENPFGHGELALRRRYHLGRALAAHGYQRAYILPNSLKSALVPVFAGIPERIGFLGESRYALLSSYHRLDKEALPLMVERYAQLAEAPAAALPRPLPRPHLQSTPAQQAAVLQALGLGSPRRPVVFCPGAEFGAAKRWPIEHYAALARALADCGHDIWLLGSARDREVGEAIVAAAGNCRNLCGTTSLDQAIDLIAAAALVVTNDSGLMHITAALNRPLIALFGSSSPQFTPPLCDSATVLRLDLACSPCFKRECPLGHLDCLQKLEPARVLDACLAKLAA